MGVGQVQELVPKLGSKEEEISETKCLICFKEFRTVTERKEHFKICRKSLVCEKCSKRFEVVKWYERQIDICDGNDKFRCYSCGDEYKDGRLVMIIHVNVEESYTVKDVTRSLLVGDC